MSAPIKIGDTTIHRIVEQEGPFFDALTFFPKLTRELLEENLAWLQPQFIDADRKLMLCIQSYLVRTPHHNILIDSCVGNHKSRPTRPFWNMMTSDRFEKNLAATGLGVGDIDFVMCTHLHTDHVGWNTRLENGRWVPTFPKARYVFADRELAFWTKRQKDEPAACPWIEDSVLPIVAANRADIVKSAHAFNDLVTLIPTPGHTIDHYSVQVGKSGADARHHRRHDPFAAAGALSRARHDGGLRLQAGRGVAAAIVRPVLRHADADVHRALPLALDRPGGAPQRCVRHRGGVTRRAARFSIKQRSRQGGYHVDALLRARRLLDGGAYRAGGGRGEIPDAAGGPRRRRAALRGLSEDQSAGAGAGARLDGGEPLAENTAILPFLGKRFGLWPTDTLAEAKALSLIGFFAGSVHPAHAHISRPERYAADPALFPAIQQKGRETFHHYLKQVDAMLEGRTWFSERYSVLDPYGFTFYTWGVRRELPMGELKNYTAFKDRMLDRPAVRRVVEDEKIKV